MARELPLFSETFDLLASTTARQYYAVKMSTTADHATIPAVRGELCIGVVQDKSSSGGNAAVMIYGITKAAHDGTVTPGVTICASSNGLLTTSSTAGRYDMGLCLAAGSTVSGTLITMLLLPLGENN